jgi:hypothetical protein
MGKGDKENSLNLMPIDYVTSAAKAALNTVPFAGSLLAEVAGVIIPNQRIDRIIKFAKKLEERLEKIDKDMVWLKLKDENFTDLLEEGLRQSARALSEERQEYLASVIANSISSEDVEFIESKHLLRILGEINDIEVIWLRFYLLPTIGGDQSFRKKHEEILKPFSIASGSTQSALDKKSLQESYKEHLRQLGLLDYLYKFNNKTKQPEFDNSTGGLKTRGYRITTLGRLMLRQMGFSEQTKI